MSILPPKLILKCPACNNQLSFLPAPANRTLFPWFTDGVRGRIALPTYAITKCLRCNQFIKPEEAEVLKEISGSLKSDEMLELLCDAPVIYPLETNELATALDSGVMGRREDEIWLRIKLNQLYNNAYRVQGISDLSEYDLDVKNRNINKIIELLVERRPSKVIKMTTLKKSGPNIEYEIDYTDLYWSVVQADLFRSLGDFNTALNHLGDIKSFRWELDDLEEHYNKIRELVLKQDTRVTLIR